MYVGTRRGKIYSTRGSRLLFALAWYFSGQVYLYPCQFRPALAKSWQARSTFLRSKNQRAMQKMLGPHLSGTQRNTDPPWGSDVSSARGQHRLLPRPLVEKQMLSEQDVSAYCVPSKKQTAPPQMWQHVLPNATFRLDGMLPESLPPEPGLSVTLLAMFTPGPNATLCSFGILKASDWGGGSAAPTASSTRARWAVAWGMGDLVRSNAQFMGLLAVLAHLE